MTNIFRKILNELSPSKIEIVPNDPKDKQVADQMSSMINFYRTGANQNIDPEYIEMVGGLSEDCFGKDESVTK